jgi:hypothetical protein
MQATAASSPTPLPKKPLQKQCVYQTTWASPSQMSGPWFLEKLGKSIYFNYFLDFNY